MLGNAPRHLRDSYEAEVQRLELAVKRAESVVNKERMDRIQRGALLKVSKMEKEKQKQGKGKWFLKKCELFRISTMAKFSSNLNSIPAEKRELVTRARYDALAVEGGKRAIKKAIEKKRKKINQREKRSRPFPKTSMAREDTRKRKAGGEDDIRKRRKVG